jgi:flagellar hook-length control protein FliK
LFSLPPATIVAGFFLTCSFGALPIAHWATLAHHDRQALPSLLPGATRRNLRDLFNANKKSHLRAIKSKLVFADLWPATCNEQGVRISLKPVNSNTASNQAAATKATGQSFLDTLAQTSSSAANKSAFAVAASRGSSSDTPDRGSEDQASGQQIATSENGADAQAITTAASSIRNSAAVIGSEQNQDADPSLPTLTIGWLASSAHSQPQSKASQSAEKQATDSTQQAGDQGAAQQLVVSVPAVALSAVSIGRSLQGEAASPNQQTFATALGSNANSTEQAGSDGAGASQSSVPTSTSPATTDLSEAIAAGLIGQSAFAIGSTFSQSMILSKGDATGTSTDKASQFKSSGATFSANLGDTSASKVSSTQDSIAADHSAQNANPLLQHAQGDSSAATPLAVKPLEATVTQTVPASNHTASVSSAQPHAASSASDTPTKAQDSADAAAEQLERAGTGAAAGISTARLIQTMGESEMRVGMRSAEFGDISIRTSVSQQQLTAQISVDHSELGNAISAHLPSLVSKLGSDFGLHASIEVNQLGGSATGGNGQSSHQNHKMTSQSVPPDSLALQADGDPIILPRESRDFSRLDIRA